MSVVFLLDAFIRQGLPFAIAALTTAAALVHGNLWWPLVTGILVLGMALATVPPALRAARVDPLTALRVER